MGPIEACEFSGVCHEMLPVITPIFKSTPNLRTTPLFQSSQLSNCGMHKIKQPTKTQQESIVTLSQDVNKAGTFVSVDYHVVNHVRQIAVGLWQSSAQDKFHLKEDEKVNVEMPLGTYGKFKVLCIQKIPCGLCQSPCAF